MRIGSGEEWSFLNGAWQDGPETELIPPDGTDIEYCAVRKNERYDDFTARFRFRLRNIASVRFLFRLQDSRRFYALDIPFGAQQFTSRACWAGLLITDGTALQRYLSFRLVPGLCARLEHWYEARLTATGPRLRAWIDDIPAADVEDSAYSCGHIGLASIPNPWLEGARFDRVTVEGQPEPALEPLCLQPPAPHWITPCPETDPDTWQGYSNLIQSASGEVILYLVFGNPNHGQIKRTVFIRSRDGGRTWGQAEPATLDIGFGGPFVRRDGVLVCLHAGSDDPAEPLNAYESADEGRTWTGPRPLRIAGGWPGDEWLVVTVWRSVRMQDGSLVAPLICKPAGIRTHVDGSAEGEGIYRQYHAAMVIRSEDDGHTWSAPILCDARTDPCRGKPWSYHLPLEVYGGRCFEVAMDEAEPGSLVGIGRPGIAPYMWQLRSADGGRTWEPACIGHFPGYCPSLTRTACGALVATTRYPYFSAHLSRDGSRTWSPPIIVDYCYWANQQAIEIEPDVVLVTYMGKIMAPGEPDSRIARLRVTDSGLALDH